MKAKSVRQILIVFRKLSIGVFDRSWIFQVKQRLGRIDYFGTSNTLTLPIKHGKLI